MNYPQHPPLSPGKDLNALHTAVTRWTLGASLIGMVSYSAIELYLERPEDLSNFLIHHLLHVALIGVAVWIASMLVIRRFVIEPVDRIFVHLRRVAAGRLEYLDFEVEAKEVGGVITSVNELISRLRRVPEPDSVSQALDHIRSLREELRGSADKLGNEVVPVMRLVAALEGDLLNILQLTEPVEDHPRSRLPSRKETSSDIMSGNQLN